MIDLARHPASFRQKRQTWSAHFNLGETQEQSDSALHAALCDFARIPAVHQAWPLLCTASLKPPMSLKQGSHKVLIVAASWHVAYALARHYSSHGLGHQQGIGAISHDLTRTLSGLKSALPIDLNDRIAADAWEYHHERLGARSHRGE